MSSFPVRNPRLRGVKEPSQIHRIVSDVAVLGGYQLRGHFLIMDLQNLIAGKTLRII